MTVPKETNTWGSEKKWEVPQLKSCSRWLDGDRQWRANHHKGPTTAKASFWAKAVLVRGTKRSRQSSDRRRKGQKVASYYITEIILERDFVEHEKPRAGLYAISTCSRTSLKGINLLRGTLCTSLYDVKCHYERLSHISCHNYGNDACSAYNSLLHLRFHSCNNIQTGALLTTHEIQKRWTDYFLLRITKQPLKRTIDILPRENRTTITYFNKNYRQAYFIDQINAQYNDPKS